MERAGQDAYLPLHSGVRHEDISRTAATAKHMEPFVPSKNSRVTELPADPGLNLEFVDEALNLVRDAEAKGIRLRILGSIAYRLQCPRNLHLFQDTKRVLTDVISEPRKNKTAPSANF